MRLQGGRSFGEGQGGGHPCIPSVGASNDNKGAVYLSLETSGCDSGLGFRIYRDNGNGGSLYFLKDIGSATSMLDIRVAVGKAYRYAASSYTVTNTEGNRSATASVTVVDTTPPAVPSVVVLNSGSQAISTTWTSNGERDLLGYDVYMSTVGGAYVKLNGSPIQANGSPQWAETGLSSGTQYCFEIDAVDQHGNTSALTAAVCGTPNP